MANQPIPPAKFIPTLSPEIPQEQSNHFRQLYTASNDHDSAIVALHTRLAALEAAVAAMKKT